MVMLADISSVAFLRQRKAWPHLLTASYFLFHPSFRLGMKKTFITLEGGEEMAIFNNNKKGKKSIIMMLTADIKYGLL